MAEYLHETVPLPVGEMKTKLSARLVTAAIKLGEVNDLPPYDGETGVLIPENIAIFDNRFLEVVFLGDARAQASLRNKRHTPELWLPEACYGIRQAAKSMPPMKGMEKRRLYTNPAIREGSYEDMMEHVSHADGTPLSSEEATGRTYAAKVALEEVIFIP